MTKVFTKIIKLSDSSVKGFEVAESSARSSERRDRINKLRKSA